MPDATNGLFVVEGYGSKRWRVVAVSHGMSIISSEVDGRNHRAFHPMRVTSGSFSVRLAFISYEEYRSCAEWFKVYAERVSSPDGTLPAMRVVVPAVNFDRMAVPAGPIPFGRSFDQYAFTMDMPFKGTSDLIDLTDTDLSSISAAYNSTYYEQGGAAGQYTTNYAIASLSEAIGSGATTYEDALYAPRVPSIPSPQDIPPAVGPDGSIIG